jgi:hypothetical protein
LKKNGQGYYFKGKQDTFPVVYIWELNMSEKEKWMFQEFILKRWKISLNTFYEIIIDGFPCYDENEEEFFNDEYDDERKAYKYKFSDVVKFENENPHLFEHLEGDFDAKDKRQLGQLKREKEKWIASLNVAVQIGIFCKEQTVLVTRSMVWDKVFEIDNTLPDAVIERIWKSIPEQYKSKGGRPKKEAEKKNKRLIPRIRWPGRKL